MNAKRILLAVIAGCALGITMAAAQQQIEYPIPDALLPKTPTILMDFDCTLTFKEGGANRPVRVKGASDSDAQRNAMALATPTGASCAPVASRAMY